MITTAHSKVRKKIKESWSSHKNTVRQLLQSAITSIHLLLDIWTSLNGHLLLGIITHYMNHTEDKLIKALLAFRPINGYSGKD